MKNEITYQTRDLGEAAAIVTAGINLNKIKDQNSRHCIFVFSDSDKCAQIANAFWSGALQVSAIKYHANLKQLKARVYSVRLPVSNHGSDRNIGNGIKNGE